ncbi:hypothetical protein G5B41_04765 [bacterium SGD-2]|nr:hypothetical protein [bacterium SGD-2]
MSADTDIELGLLTASAQRFLAERRDMIIQGACARDDRSAALWRECVELGWLLTCVPAERDGAGMGTAAAAALLEVLGASLLPLPVAEGVAAATLLAALHTDSFGETDVQQWLQGEQLTGIVQGTVVRHAFMDTALRLQWREATLHVETVNVSHAGFGVDPLVPVGQPGSVRAAAQMPCEESLWQAYAARRRALLLAEALGAAQGALKLAVEYARERSQFGRAIGSYQAIKHPLANHRMALDDARLALHDACAAIDVAPADTGTEARLLMAELLVQEVMHATVEGAIQTHGALGFTWECPLHFHFKRVKQIGACLRQQHDQAVILERLWHLAA